ncbi:hypothetical protein BG015_003223, partial [Linnemannia schmuckeri]
MSLPRFLRGLQKKPTIPVHPDPNLSDSSSSSFSSGPKDALGFPIPAFTVITPTVMSAGNDNNISPGPMDIVTPEYRLSATSTSTTLWAVSSSAAAIASTLSTPTTSVVPAGTQLMTNNYDSANNKARNRSSRSSSASSVNSSSLHQYHHHRPAGSTTTTMTTNKDNSPQLLSKSFPSTSSQYLSLSVPPPPPSTTMLPTIPILTSSTATETASTPMVNLTSPSQTRPPLVICPSSASSSSVTNSTSTTTTTITTITTETATLETATDKPIRTTMGFDIVVSYVEDQSDSGSGGGSGNSSGASSRRNSRSTATGNEIDGFGDVDQTTKEQQQFTELEGSEAGAGVVGGGVKNGKTGRIRSNHQQQLLEGDGRQTKRTSTNSSTSSFSSTSLSSFSTNTGPDRDLSAASGAAVAAIQRGPRWGNNSDLEQPPETLPRELIGASVVVQERATRRPKLHHNINGSSSSSSNNKATTISSTRSRSSSTPLIAPASLRASAGAAAASASVSSTSSISSSPSFSSTSATGSGSNSTTAASQPVSILKHTIQPLPSQVQQRPKSILRSRSGSHPSLPVPLRPLSMSLSEPSSPQHSPTKSTFPSTARLSITSDTSSLSRSSSFLQQDPMEQEPSPIIGAMNTTSSTATAAKSGNKKGSSQSHRRLSAKDLEGTRS